MAVDFGDLPSWITAAVAVGGVIYGGWNLRALRIARMREQADHIYFGSEFDHDSQKFILHILNLSQTPVTNLAITARTFPGMLWAGYENKGLLNMGEDWELWLRPPSPSTLVVMYVEFTDASNRHWYKLGNGMLFAFEMRPGLIARFRYFLPNWLIRLRTWRRSEVQKAQWMTKHGFEGGLFRWGYEKQFGDLDS